MPKIKLTPGTWEDLGFGTIVGQARAQGGTVQIVGGTAPTTPTDESSIEFFEKQLLVFPAPTDGNLYATVTKGTGSISYYEA